MRQRRVLFIFLCCLPFLGCMSSTTTTKKVHHHGAKINTADFIKHSMAYKGKTITLILRMDPASAKTPASGQRGRDLTFTKADADNLSIVITMPEEISIPQVGPSDDLMVTFVCGQGSLRQGNIAKAVQIPDGSDDD